MIGKIYKINENAITIPALIITVILILILASISISAISQPGGLIEKVKMAKLNSKTEEIREKVQFKLSSLMIKKEMEEQKEITLEDVLKLKDNDDEISNAYKEDDKVVLIVGEYECKISKQLQVETVTAYNPNILRKAAPRSYSYCSFPERLLED